MTTTAEDTDLSWVTWAPTGDGEPCDGLYNRPCNREAIAVAVWEWPCGHGLPEHRLCVSHRDELVAYAAGAEWFACRVCDEPVRLVKVVPAR